MDKGRDCEEGVVNMEGLVIHLHMTITGMSQISCPAPGQKLTNHTYQSATQTALPIGYPREIEYKGLCSTTAHPRGLVYHIESISWPKCEH